MIDRKNNARASFPDFFEVVFVRNTRCGGHAVVRIDHGSSFSSPFRFRPRCLRCGRNVVGQLWYSSISEFPTEDTPTTLERGSNREVDCPHPWTNRSNVSTTKGEQRRGTQTRNHSFFIRITNIENMGLHSSGEQLP